MLLTIVQYCHQSVGYILQRCLLFRCLARHLWRPEAQHQYTQSYTQLIMECYYDVHYFGLFLHVGPCQLVECLIRALDFQLILFTLDSSI
jgi:hypothetical protein